MGFLFARVVFYLLLSVPLTIQAAQDHVLDLVLPTDNDALFSGDGPAFYQYVDRDYDGVKSAPWEGGQYGFVRDPKSTGGGIIYTRFHEGIDIRSVHRDTNGEPLDEVRAIADGRLCTSVSLPGYSNYGKYIVIEHRWGGSNYYSLYGTSQLDRSAARPDCEAWRTYRGDGLHRNRHKPRTRTSAS